MSSALVWQIIRSNNSFVHKSLHGHLFSREAGNLYNKHSYKYSGTSFCAHAPGWGRREGSLKPISA